MMRGTIGGNTKFNMVITLNNATNTTIVNEFLLVSANFNTTAGDLPTFQLSFAR
jgi:hypothetical protein